MPEKQQEYSSRVTQIASDVTERKSNQTDKRPLSDITRNLQKFRGSGNLTEGVV